MIDDSLLAHLRDQAVLVGMKNVRDTCKAFILQKTYDRERYAAERKLKVPKAWVRLAHDRQKGICPRCGKYIEARQMSGDHRQPVAAGGVLKMENIDCLHKHPCNSAKGARSLAEDARYSGVGIKKYIERTMGGSQ